MKRSIVDLGNSQNNRRRVWQYKHADFERANDLLMEVDPLSIIDHNSIELSWYKWKQTFTDIIEQCIPSSVLPNRKNLPWLTKEIIQCMRKRNNLFKKAKASSDPNDYQNYKVVRNKVVKKLRESKRQYFESLNPSNPKEFWKMTKILLKKKKLLFTKPYI